MGTYEAGYVLGQEGVKILAVVLGIVIGRKLIKKRRKNKRLCENEERSCKE